MTSHDAINFRYKCTIFVKNLLEPLFISIKAIFFVKNIVFIWFQFPKQVPTPEPDDMRMLRYGNTNKHLEYMNLRI